MIRIGTLKRLSPDELGVLAVLTNTTDIDYLKSVRMPVLLQKMQWAKGQIKPEYECVLSGLEEKLRN